MPTCGRTLKLINATAGFHPKPWLDQLPPGWLLRYTLALAIEVEGAKVGDLVCADTNVDTICRGLLDVRPTVKGKPTTCQVTIACRVSDRMPEKTVLDLEPGKTDALGWLKDANGGILVEDYGPDGGVTGGLDSPYVPVARHLSFIVWQVPVYLLVWIAPKSAGQDGTCSIGLPGTSNFSKLSYELHPNGTDPTPPPVPPSSWPVSGTLTMDAAAGTFSVAGALAKA